MSLKKLFLGVLLVALTNGVYCQNTITTTGGESVGAGSVSFTVGQIVYSQISDSDNFIIQGVQQPYEIYSSSNDKNIVLEYSVYPNPTTDFLNLTITNYNHNKLSYKVYDNNGKLVKQSKLHESKSKINMTYLSSATYYIVISNDLKILKSFKIIKN